MNLNAECMECLLRRNLATARLHGSEAQVTAFARDIMKLFLDEPGDMASPYYSMRINELMCQRFGLPQDRYREEKAASNRFALEHLEQIRQNVESAPDPVYAGLQCAILGNYLDFSALQGEVSFDHLEQLLRQSRQIRLDPDTYARLCRDLEKGKRLLYLTDNAGEIGFDRIFAEQLQRRYRHLTITFCVRGGPALNDATREDAEAVGIGFPVIDNGNRVAGTVIALAGDELKQELGRADVIFAKGQANVETLLGCGLNVYYAFLVKCSRFIQLFHQPKLTPMLHRELD